MSSEYKVLWSVSARVALGAMAAKCSSALREQLTSIVDDLNQQLKADPASVGEIYKNSPPVSQYAVVRVILSFDFAVDDSRKLVLVRRCTALSGHGLE